MIMKYTWILILTFAACNDSKKDAQPVINNGTEKTVTQSGFDPAEAVDLIGAWIRTSTHYDDNSNKVLDEPERAKQGPPLGFDYFLFKNDGSCVRDMNIRFDGTYDIIKKNGERIIEIKTVPPGETYKYTIVGTVNDELVLHNSGVFLVFKKE
jgi:hypothetical protein